MNTLNTIWKVFTMIAMLIVVVFMIISKQPEPVRAQSFGTNFVWLHKNTALTTTALDCTYVTQWESVFFKADTGDVLIKFATGSDTASWDSRPFYKLEAGESLSFGPGTRLTRAEYKSNAGTVDFFTLGYKKTSQY